MEQAKPLKIGKLVVTGRGPFTARKTRAAIREVIRGAKITRSGFRSVFVVEAEGDALELARQLYRDCAQRIGHATAVSAEVESKPDPIKEAAIKIATEQVAPDKSFCFRLNKRGAHNLPEDTPKIEHEIGGAIYTTLEQKDATKPIVTLTEPDITIIAEVLGPSTLVGILRKDWQALPLTADLKTEAPFEEPGIEEAKAAVLAKSTAPVS